MPKPMQYRSGSLIYFKGDPANQVFILQQGKVNLTYQDIETNEDQHDLVQPGEFFGVKSALGRYPREENAVSIQDASVMAFTVPEFEALAAANTRIIMKMLKVFSSQLRRVHHQVSNLVMEKEEQDPEEGLYNLGKYYLKNRRFSEAKHILSRYLTYYPTGKNSSQAASDLEAAERASPGKSSGSSGSKAPTEGSAPRARQSEAAKAYSEAAALFSQAKYQQAYFGFKKIVDANEDPEFIAKSFSNVGRCLFFLGKHEDCIKHFTMMITKYPKHPDLPDGLFYMGQSYEKMNSRDQATAFYRKILSMAGKEEDAVQIKARKALKALGA